MQDLTETLLYRQRPGVHQVTLFAPELLGRNLDPGIDLPEPQSAEEVLLALSEGLDPATGITATAKGAGSAAASRDFARDPTAADRDP